MYNLVNFDICMHQETITIIKVANIAITPKSFLVPLVFSYVPSQNKPKFLFSFSLCASVY